jgi:hypothetical protein
MGFLTILGDVFGFTSENLGFLQSQKSLDQKQSYVLSRSMGCEYINIDTAHFSIAVQIVIGEPVIIVIV